MTTAPVTRAAAAANGPAAAATATPATSTRYRVRWVMLAYLFGFAFIAYMQRTSFSVASAQMMPELGISQIQLGWLMTAYLVTYALFQLPGGVFGQWLGARRGLVVITLVALLATLATPLAPLWFKGAALTAVLLLSRLVVGAAHAPLFPISTGMIEAWFPIGRWGWPNGLQSAGMQLGSAAATPLIALLMVAYGWKQTLVWTSLPVLLLVVLWARYGRNRPAEHPGVTATELAELGAAHATPPVVSMNRRDLMRVLGNRDVVLLAVSYTIMNYVFYLLASWSFLYLVQERHLSVPDSGLLGALPFIAAAIGCAVGGKLCDRCAARFGARLGYRIVPLITLPLAGLLQYIGVKVGSPFWAVGALSLTYCAIEMTEGPYAAATIAVAREHSMTAYGVVGTGGNLGGIIGTPLVAWFTAHGAWTAAFLTGTVAAVISGVMWLWIDASRVIGTDGAAATGQSAGDG